MIDVNAFGVSVAGMAYSAGSFRLASAKCEAAVLHPASATAHAGTSAHAAGAVAAIATDASVNRGSI